jgi:hypothetical protein
MKKRKRVEKETEKGRQTGRIGKTDSELKKTRIGIPGLY